MGPLSKALEEYQNNPKKSLAFEILQGEDQQFVVRENKKKPGEPIFVREDGKVGFPTINSIRVDIGDTIRGYVRHEEPSYFLVEIREII
jgi:hypothetical protein